MDLKLFLFALTFIAGITISTSTGEPFKLAKQCAKEFEISKEEAGTLMAGNFTKVTENYQCFIKCIMNGNNMLNEKDDFQPQVVIEKFSKIFSREKVEERTQKCEDIEGANPCEKAFNIFKCLREKRKPE